MLNDWQLKLLVQQYKDDLLQGLESFRDDGATGLEVWQKQAAGLRSIKWLDFNSDFSQILRIFGEHDSKPDIIGAINHYVRLIELSRDELGDYNYCLSTRLAAKNFVIDNHLDVVLPQDQWFNENEEDWFYRCPPEFNKICRKILQTKIEAYGIEIDRLRGNYQNAYDAELNRKRPQHLLSQLIDQFCEWRQAERATNEETQRRYKQHFTTMLSLLGDKDLTEYSHRDLLDLKAKLHRWPSNVNKKREYRGKSVAEILEMPVETPLDKRTINSNYMGKIASLFGYAYRHDQIPKDIAQHLVSSLTAAEKKARKRHPYSYEDLRKIFEALPFDRKQPHLAWVPLLAAYSGARQGEICQLLVSDIKQAGKIFYMDITEEDDTGVIVKNLKNENSKRQVPLHPVILGMGFIDFVTTRQTQGKRNIFETRNYKALTGQYFSKRYQHFNNRVIGDKKKVFHSFRHTVHNELKQKGVVPDVYHAITGHAPLSEMDAVYTLDYSLENKNKALSHLYYPSLDLDKLREQFKRLI